MSTRALALVAILALGAFAGIYFAFNRPDSEVLSPLTSTGKPKPKPRPLLDGWEKPAAALILTGEMHGYLEPCGCTEGQYGGLARRGDLIKKVKARGWPVAGFDVGGLINRPNRHQASFKLTSAVKSLQDIGYQAIAMGREEVQADAGLFVNLPSTPAYLSANLVLFAAGDVAIQDALAEPGVGRQPWKLVDIGGVKVAVTSVFGLRYQAEILGTSGRKGDFSAVDPAAALKLLLPTVKEAQPDLLLLLSHASVAESKDLAESLPAFDLVVSAGSADEPPVKPEFVGKTMFLTVGTKGRHTGVVGFYPKAETRLRYELVDLDGQRFEHLPQMDENMKLYQDTLVDNNVATGETPVPHPGKGSVDGAELRFVGALKCGECHTKAYSKWSTSNHAHAFDSLIKGRKDEKNPVARNHDPECLACHVTGWDPKEVTPYVSGYLFEKPVKDRRGKPYAPDLKGQQCENCHGPGNAHVAAEEAWKKSGKITQETRDWRAFMHNDLATVKQQVCVRCHDLDNSPKFHEAGAFEKYWEKVKHPGKD